MESRRFDDLARVVTRRRSLIAAVVAVAGAALRPNRSLGAIGGLTMTPSIGTVGSTVNATILGMSPNSTVTIRWFNGSNAIIVASNVALDGTGYGSTTFTVPNGARGSHLVRARDSANITSDRTFQVQASATITPRATFRGTTLTARVRGFAANRKVTLWWYTEESPGSNYRIVAEGMTNGVGSRDLTWTIGSTARIGGHLAQVCAPNGTQIGSQTVNVCGPNQRRDGNGGCCSVYKASCSSNSDCCSGGCSQATGKCAAPIGANIGDACTEPGFTTSECVGGYCDDDRTCVLIALGPGQACYSNTYCASGVCTLSPLSPSRGYCA